MKVSVLLIAVTQAMLATAAATAGTSLQTTGTNADVAAAAGIETIFTSSESFSLPHYELRSIGVWSLKLTLQI